MANGAPFHIKGCNFVGTEGRAGPPLGLDKHPIAWYMRFLRTHKFNAVRLLFNHQMILTGAMLDPPNLKWCAEHGVADCKWEAPELEGYAYLDMFAKLAEVAAQHGILVLMACHRLKPDAWPGKGLWYDGEITEASVLESWRRLAAALCGQWNVFGVDLMNEPHAASWGKSMGTGSDWGHAAERIGNHVLRQCPRWMIFVEGIGYSPGAPGFDNSGMGIWWGENLAGARTQPVQLSNPARLVYSPHTYGPGTFMQRYFNDRSFPSNLAAIWSSRFAFLTESSQAPVVIGEMGGWYTGKDQQWQDWAVRFMKERNIGIFYFVLQPTSDDTGGLLKADWASPEDDKLRLLDELPSTDVVELMSATG